jgi:hypothetical protein
MKLFLVYNAKFRDDTVKNDLVTLSKATEKFDCWMFPCFHSDVLESTVKDSSESWVEKIHVTFGSNKVYHPYNYISFIIQFKNISSESEWPKKCQLKHRFTHTVPELKTMDVPKIFKYCPEMV